MEPQEGAGVGGIITGLLEADGGKFDGEGEGIFETDAIGEFEDEGEGIFEIDAIGEFEDEFGKAEEIAAAPRKNHANITMQSNVIIKAGKKKPI